MRQTGQRHNDHDAFDPNRRSSRCVGRSAGIVLFDRTCLARSGRKEDARRVLAHFDQQVQEKDFPYGMTSSRGNMHNIIASEFLRACYMADDLPLAKKVTASIKKDLQEQLRYYHSLGDEQMTNEQMINVAYELFQGKGGEMPVRQISFVNDILSSWQLLQQLEAWEKSQQKI